MIDVAIIGAGVCGCAIARELARLDIHCVLIDKHAEASFGTSKANSGIVHASQHSPNHMLKGQLVVKGNAAFDQLSEELGFLFERNGELLIARSHADIPELERMKRLGEEKGVLGLEILNSEALRKLEPSLSHDIVAALHAPSAGVINPFEYCFALHENAVNNGIVFMPNTEVLGLKSIKDGLRIDLQRDGKNESIEAHFVINAAGVHAAKLASFLGEPGFSIHPRKGQEYLLDRAATGGPKRLIFPLPSAESKGILIIPTVDNNIILGPTAENIDDFYDLSTDRAGQQKIFDSARKTCPNLKPLQPIAHYAGLRAVSNTDDFIIGTTKHKGFINVAGIQSPGLTAAPEIANMVVRILKDEGLSAKPRMSFNPIRKHYPRVFRSSLKEQRELIKKEPRYADIVCRCETISRGEIEDSIDAGARTLDGIKFRSRAGAGRCQAGFCTMRCLEILAQKRNVPIATLCKNDDGSWILLDR
ncbi:MAG: NAD(P)/FAD-dependent oxidoreductase [Bradymonadia bacterium]